MRSNLLAQGLHTLTEMAGPHSGMLMDIALLVCKSGDIHVFSEPAKETALLLLNGTITFAWADRVETIARGSVFDEGPTCLHVPCGTTVTLTAQADTEVLIQKTENPQSFAPVFYTPSDTEQKILGADNMQGTARRVLRDIFHYGNAPYSRMVMGEVITLPGKWSSYPPHHHPQPEVYFYRFDRPQGFGVSLIGDSARIVRHNDISAIPGGLCHPQVSAPGYAMYYCWMIRHLDGNPWTDRIDDPDHVWLHDKNAVIWEENLL